MAEWLESRPFTGRDFSLEAKGPTAMREKPDRLRGGKLKNYKARGEWAELYFMMLAAGEGMKVSKPFGDSGKYDVGVENQKRVLRVQVKSAAYAQRENNYCFNLMGPDPERPKYLPGTIDFFAILLIPADVWFIVPFEVVAATARSAHFSPSGIRQKYGEYWEAWCLLKETGLVIQACADDECTAADEPFPLCARNGKPVNPQFCAHDTQSHVSQKKRDVGHP